MLQTAIGYLRGTGEQGPKWPRRLASAPSIPDALIELPIVDLFDVLSRSSLFCAGGKKRERAPYS
jgi:hypothetical protein